MAAQILAQLGQVDSQTANTVPTDPTPNNLVICQPSKQPFSFI